MKTLWALLLLGCAPTAAVDPVWGRQPCAHCRMIVDDRRSAAQLVDNDGERWFFDDAGCLAAWQREHPAQTRRAWVRAADAGLWLPAESARFATGARTPMGYGFIANAAPTDGAVGWDAVAQAAAHRGEP
jgi:hypothetical protein